MSKNERDQLQRFEHLELSGMAEQAIPEIKLVFPEPLVRQQYLETLISIWRSDHHVNGGGPMADFEELMDWLAMDLSTRVNPQNANLLAITERESIFGLPELVDDEREPETNDSVGWQLHQTANHRLLTADEEVYLGRIVQCGRRAKLVEKSKVTTLVIRQAIVDGKAARDDMVRYNQKLVISVAKKYFSENFTPSDLIQMGNMGLLKGVNNFDPERGLRFSTYATWWIRQGISRQRQDSEYQIRLPVQMHWRMSDVDKARKRLEVKGERVTIRSLATEAGLNPRQVKEILVYRANLMHPVGLDISSSGDDEKSSLAELVEDEQDTPEEQLVDTQKREIVEALIGELPEREALILRRRFGFYDGRSWTLDEIGKVLGLTRERVRQIETRALRRLKEPKTLLKFSKLR